MKNKRTRSCFFFFFFFFFFFVVVVVVFFFFFFRRTFCCRVMPFSTVFYFAIISLWNIVNKIPREPLELGYSAHRLCPKCRWHD